MAYHTNHHNDHTTSEVGLGIAGRGAFVLIPATALLAVLWLLLTQDLPAVALWSWVPSLGVELAFRVDGLSALMLLMITGVGTAVFIYAGGYLAGHPQQARLYVLLTLFMVAMIGSVTADNLIVLFLFWEMTSLMSFLLVGFNHEDEKSRKSAQQALLVTGTGGLVMLAGFIMLGQALGTYSLSTIIALVPTVEHTTSLTVALCLILVGAFTKSAQFPFHFWLPNAMSAPTPVSAYLHSATMVKLGVYLVARLDPAFGDWTLWAWTLTTVGSITAAWGMVLALRERDLKRILAWSTVATLGTLVALVGLTVPGATVAVATLLLAHALYKASLFFVAGNVDHGTGTRIIDRLGNLRHAMPWTAAAALLAAISMAGIPLSFGFVAKDVISVALDADGMFVFAKVANTVFSAIVVAVAAVAAIRVFWRHPGNNVTPLDAHEGGPSLAGPPLVLASMGIVFGLFPFFVQDLIALASVAMSRGAELEAIDLSLAVGPALLSVAVTLAVGLTVFAFWDALHRFVERHGARLWQIGMVAQYERLLRGIPKLSAATTRALQHGSLPGYGALVLATITVVMGVVLVLGAAHWVWPSWGAASAGFVGACVLVLAGGALAVSQKDRLVLLLAAGLVGFGSGVFFLYAGAPDVAFTQFVVESVFVVVVASVLLKLRLKGRGQGLEEKRGWFTWAVAIGFGTVVTAWFLVSVAGPLDPALTNYFAERSVTEAFGRNVVNVILVDFRALDTLGEITVVMLSFLAAWSLLTAVRASMKKKDSQQEGA